TDMSLPQDIDAVRIEILQNGAMKYDHQWTLGVTAMDTKLPATLGVSPGATAMPITPRVIAFRNATPRVLRELIPTVPTDRDALARMPLEWVCAVNDSITANADGSFTSNRCGSGKTCVGGTCQQSIVDANGLLDYQDAEVFGGGTPTSGGM